MTIITILDYVGVFMFAVSGIITASGKQLDLFGGVIVGFVTALGGGTLRDLLLDTQIAWIDNTNYIYTVLLATVAALIFKKPSKNIRRTIFLFDTIGIALFTILGVQKALALETPVIVACIFGVVTATFGGVIRDILCTEIPLIFRKEIYAVACLIGAILYCILYGLDVDQNVNLIVSGLTIMVIRTIVVIKNISLPVINDRI